jgi:DNA-binding NarL/FixJ family response regulator
MSDGVRVLIVDDDVPTRVGVRTILQSEPGFDVVGEAATGTQAIEMVDALRPDVVLMDVRLPDIDGIGVTQHVLGSDPETDGKPRVIVLTTFDHDQYAYRSLQAGASGFLLKRTPAEDLIDAVRTVAEGRELPVSPKTRALIEAFAQMPDDRRGSTVRDSLTPRECEVLVLVARGLSNAEIAEALSLSVETVRTHVKRVYMKCRVRDRAQAVIVAYETGLVPLSS